MRNDHEFGEDDSNCQKKPEDNFFTSIEKPLEIAAIVVISAYTLAMLCEILRQRAY